MEKLDRHSSSIESSTEKYHIFCKNLDLLRLIETIHINKERAILKALLENKSKLKRAEFVVKIGTGETISKEYRIGTKLYREIPGFIEYYCLIKCTDSLDNKLCTGDKKDQMMNILVMPYISAGSMRSFDWNETNMDLFKSCLKQLFISLYIAFNMFGFLHTDIHLGNVLMKPTTAINVMYFNTAVPLYGYKIVIMDFEHSFIGVDKKETGYFYKDIGHILDDIGYHLELHFTEMSEIYTFVTSRYLKQSNIDDFVQVINQIDSLTFISKPKRRAMLYNVFN
jgi:hypothetical protein